MIDAKKLSSFKLGGNIAQMPRTIQKFSIPGLSVAQNIWSDDIRLLLSPAGTIYKVKIDCESDDYNVYFYTRAEIVLPSIEAVAYLNKSNYTPYIANSVGGFLIWESGNFDCTWVNSDVPQQPYLYMRIENKTATTIENVNLEVEMGQL